MGRPERTLEQCKEHARQNGGECLEDHYFNDAPMRWRCAQNHEWPATADSVVGHAKSWCKRCSDQKSGLARRHTIEESQALATERGGWCLSTKYRSNKSKLQWKCQCGHKWKTSYNSVHNGTWCSKCANERKRQDNNLGLDKMHALAAVRQGKCLSTYYANVGDQLIWKCAKGHVFEKRASGVIAGHWCPECGSIQSERVCRKIMEHLFSKPFLRCRPAWLLGKAGVPLELDGYNDGLAIAFEYQGVQHYKTVVKFKICSDRLAKIQKDDRWKAAQCKKRKIALVVIPYTIGHNDLERFIRDELQRLGKARSEWADQPLLDLQTLTNLIDERLEVAIARGQQKNLTCLSDSYIRHDLNLNWRCDRCGNEFPCRPDRFSKVATPCPRCRKTQQLAAREQVMLDKIRRFLALKGQTLISDRFAGQNQKLEIACSNGHPWPVSWACLRHGVQCPFCRTNKERNDLNRAGNA